MQSTVNWNAYDTDEMVRGDRYYLRHRIKSPKVCMNCHEGGHR